MSIPQGTVVPAVLDALEAGLGPTLLGAPVLDSMPPQWPKGDCVVLGLAMPGTPSVVEAWTLDKRTMGYSEALDITCAVWSWGTDKTMKPRRDRCAALLNAIRSWLDANPDLGLGGAVYRPHIGQSVGWVGYNRGDGTQMTVGFTIHIPASV